MAEPPHGPRIDPIAGGRAPLQGLRAGVVTRSSPAASTTRWSSATDGRHLRRAGRCCCSCSTRATLRAADLRRSSTSGLGLRLSIVIVYLWVSFATSGRTIGDARHGPARGRAARGSGCGGPGAFVRAASAPSFPIGLFWCAVSRENRSVQDIVLRTSVIHDWPIPKTEVEIDDIALKRIDLGET